MAEDLARMYLEWDLKVVLYSSRRPLIEQICRYLDEVGIEHGVRAAGYQDKRWLNFQVSSLATERARTPEAVFKRARKAGKTREEAAVEARIQAQSWKLHEADLVLVDEAHLYKVGHARKTLEEHDKQGAYRCGITATPIGLGEMYDTLVVAGTNSSLRKAGVLLPIHVYGPDEPDLQGLRGLLSGQDLSEEKINDLIGRGEILFGRVWDNWKALNPDARPTILFASGVEESMYFAEEFWKRGVPAAHIDGDWIIINNVKSRATPDARRDLLEDSKYGRIKIICNRYVYREGLDATWIYHEILATVIGSPSSFLQTVGRLPRACPAYDHKILQDHGGHWWRHKSPNADRNWDLRYTNSSLIQMHVERMRSGLDEEPRRCPKCSAIMTGTHCVRCGYVFDGSKRSRAVIQSDGKLKMLEGPIFKQRKIDMSASAGDRWKQMYFRARNSRMTFHQAINFFASMNNWRWPSRSLPLMPVDDFDLFRRVRDVEMSRLIDSRPLES